MTAPSVLASTIPLQPLSLAELSFVVIDCPVRHRLRPVALALLLLLGTAAPCSLTAQRTASMPEVVPSTVLQPGDRVRLRVWREPELSGEFDVDQRGVVVFPMAGRVDVGDVSVDSLQSLLLARYAASLRDPAVEIMVLRRVNVMGEVRRPGLYHVDASMSVEDAIALAGGGTADGHRDRVELVRDGQPPVRLERGSPLAASALRSGDQIRVPERSWTSRNSGLLSATLTAAAFVLAALIR